MKPIISPLVGFGRPADETVGDKVNHVPRGAALSQGDGTRQGAPLPIPNGSAFSSESAAMAAGFVPVTTWYSLTDEHDMFARAARQLGPLIPRAVVLRGKYVSLWRKL
jgi:hypothetical protein